MRSQVPFVPLLTVFLIRSSSSAIVDAPGLCTNNTRTLLVLPGLGWDALQNKARARVIDTHYQFCHRTPDRLFLLPDGVDVEPVASSRVPLFSELFEDWTEYRSVSSRILNAGDPGRTSTKKTLLGAPTSVEGTFAWDFQSAKQRLVVGGVAIARICARHHLYNIHLGPSTTVTKDFSDALREADDAFEKNNTASGRALLGELVTNYGTHFTTEVDVGAVLIEEDDIRAEFVENNSVKKGLILEAASSFFLDMINFRIGDYSPAMDPAIDKGYRENRVNSFVEAIGGSLLRVNMTLDAWSGEVPSNPTAIGQRGASLIDVISQFHFPDMSYESMKRLRSELRRIIRKYYIFNTHVGCTNSSSPNFDYTANIGDASCDAPAVNFSFGGTYQVCTPVGPYGNFCDKYSLNVKNPLTEDYSCHETFSPVVFVDDQPKYRCRRSCNVSRCLLECYQLRIVWCRAEGEPQMSLLFGGLYSPALDNPMTGLKSCPPDYDAFLVGENVYVCAGLTSKVNRKFTIPFGGFLSFKPDTPGTKSQACPFGYSRHTADVMDPSGTVDTTVIVFCANLSSLGNNQPPQLVSPFYGSLLFMVPPVGPSSGGGENEWTTGNTVAVILGFLLLIALVLLVTGFWYFRRRNSGNIQERRPLAEQGRPPQYQSFGGQGTNGNTDIVE